MKTVLVALNAKFVHSNLALRYIREYSYMYDIELYETTINDNFLEAAMQIVEMKPDVVGFSCYLWNVSMAVGITGVIKEILPETKIVFGGPEVSFNGTDYLNEHQQLDFVIAGEGEAAFKQLLDAIASGENDFHAIKGLSFRSNDSVIENMKREPIGDLDLVPFPYEHEIPGKILYYEASRGCPFSCSYCLSGSLGAIRFFSIERVKADLKKLIDARVTLVKFVDRTFNANKHFANEIWEFLIDNASDTRFHFEIAADLLDEKSLSILSKAPKELFQLEIGVQSTNPKILENINRKMDFERVYRNIRCLEQYGNIHCHIDLIAGLPGEILDSFIRSFEDCMAMEPDVLQLGFLKVLKGTSIYSEVEKYGIRYMKHPNYHVLFTNDMSFDEIRGLMRFENVFETYYNSGIFHVTMKLVLPLYQSKYAFFSEFEHFLADRNYMGRNLDLKAKFSLLYEFLTCDSRLAIKLQQHDSEMETEAASAAEETEGMALGLNVVDSSHIDKVIKDLLVHDYILNTKKAAIPDFLKRDADANEKDIISLNRYEISAFFNGFDVKKLLHMPVCCKIIRHGNCYSVLIEDGIWICNPLTGEYCYI